MNHERIEAILRLLQGQSYVGEIAVEGDGWKLEALKAWGAPSPLPPADLLEAADTADPATIVQAGMVGVYRAPETPLHPGDFVEQGAGVGNIDSMRILNPVTAPEAGYIVEVLVEDGDPVEYGQELLVLRAQLPHPEGEPPDGGASGF